MAVTTTRAVLLRAHPYSESSLILRFFSADLGAVSAMARGVRRSGSKGGAALSTFSSGPLTLFVKDGRDLQTLKEFNPTRPRTELGEDVVRFGGGAVLAELVMRHGGESASPDLFDRLEAGFDRIAHVEKSKLVPVILSEAWSLVAALGYHPVLDVCVGCGTAPGAEPTARFDFDAGGVRCASCSEGSTGPRVGPESRARITALLRGAAVAVSRPRAHLRLLSDFVTYHVSGTKPLESFRVLSSLLPPDREP